MAKVNGSRTGRKAALLGTGTRDLPSREQFDQMRMLANQGDQGAQASLKRLLDDHEDICEQLGNVARHAQQSLIHLISDHDFLISEAIQRKAIQMRRELAGAFPGPLEILAAERVVAAWLGLQWVETHCARAEGDVRVAGFWLRRQAQAARLYDSAVKSMLLMRELLPSSNEPVIRLIDRTGAVKAATDAGRRTKAMEARPGGSRGINRIGALADQGHEAATALV